jgi:phage replication-related protein YjqB (UPF0714/DUF867 family)
MSRWYRRIAGLLSLSLSLAGCAEGPAGAPTPGHSNPASQAQALDAGGLLFMVDPTPSDAGTPVKDEHCRFSARLRDGFIAGRQVLVSSSLGTLPHVYSGLCTVDAEAHDGGVDEVHVTSDDFRARLEVASGDSQSGYATNQYPGAPEGYVAKPIARKATRTTDPGLGEYWRVPDPAAAKRVAYTAPHGGEMEPGTDEQVVALNISDTDTRNAYWAVLGEMDSPSDIGEGGAADHWHIGSGDLSEHSFQGLRDLRAQGYTYAVAFHGFSDGDITDDVIVGGNETPAFRQSVARILAHEVFVRHNRTVLDAVAPPANCNTGCVWRELAGQNPSNFVNELATSGRGLQLEQTRPTRDTHGTTIANAVKSVMDCLLDDPDDELLNTSATTSVLKLDDVGEVLTTGACPYFVGELDMLHGVAQRWRFLTSVTCGSAGCASLAGRVDVYQDNEDGTWAYVNGETFEVIGTGTTASLISDLVVDVPASLQRQYRIVVRASNVTTAPTLPTVQRGITITATRL